MLSQHVKALWSKNMEVLGCPICSHTIINSHRHTHQGTRWPDGPWTMTGWLETLFPVHSNSRSEKKKEKKTRQPVFIYIFGVLFILEFLHEIFLNMHSYLPFLLSTLNFVPELSIFLSSLLSSSVFPFLFSTINLGEPRNLGSKGKGGSTRWRRFSPTDGLRWRRETMGGKNKDEFSDYIPIQCTGHIKLHTSFKTNSHKCLVVGTLIGGWQRNLQHDKVKELGIWG